MPRVSVIVPNYNHAPFLEKRVRSILNQTFQDFEVILLDDSSTDNSREVLQSFCADPKVRCIFNESNSGCVFRQWNKGFGESAGEYIWIAESDDYADERFLEVLVGLLDDNPSAGVAYCQSRVVDENDSELFILEDRMEDFGTGHWRVDFVRNGRDELREHFLNRSCIANASSALVRKSVIDEIGGADERWRQAGDWVFWATILSRSDVAFAAQPLNYWRRHTNSVTKQNEASGRQVVEAYKVSKFITTLTDFDPASLERARALRFRGWMYHNEVGFYGFGRNREILEVAREFDPDVVGRLLRYLPRYPIMVLLRRVKSALSSGRKP